MRWTCPSSLFPRERPRVRGVREKVNSAEEDTGVYRQDGWNVRLLVVLAVPGWFIPALMQEEAQS
jgi:hypothetical protein